MLPASYAVPTAVVLALAGLLACFAGYRLFRVVLGINGFVLGAFITTSMMEPSSSWTLVAAAIVGGIVGALLMLGAFFMGVGLVGAGLAALAVNLLWRIPGGDPPTWLLIVACVLGALGALSIARHVIIFGTAIGGAWTLLVGGLALAGDPGAMRAASAGDIWILYTQPADGHWWHMAAWIALSLVGVVVQMATSKKGARRRIKRPVAA
jgi:hypothetical protein